VTADDAAVNAAAARAPITQATAASGSSQQKYCGEKTLPKTTNASVAPNGRLDLDRPLQVEAHHRLREPALDGERHAGREHDRRERDGGAHRRAAVAAPEQPRERDDRDDRRPQLRHRPEAEQDEAGDGPATGDQRQPAERERRGQHVEVRAHQRAGEHRQGHHQPAGDRAAQRPRRSLRAERAREHQQRHPHRVVAGQPDRAQRQRRVLEVEVPEREQPVVQQVAVDAVDVQVAHPGRAQRAVVRHHEPDDRERERAERYAGSGTR
jgi:hypothetical protein